jgi:hypothetical protein
MSAALTSVEASAIRGDVPPRQPVLRRLVVGPSGTGLSGGGSGNHVRAKRQQIKGWSIATARRQTRWLQSVVPALLTGLGMAVTLTLRDLPESAEVLHDLLDIFHKRMDRLGLVRGHWVTEDQERGVPHFHLALYFDLGAFGRDAGELRYAIMASWCEIAAAYGAQLQAQHVAEITSGEGWSKYCAKHSARSVRHVQRAGLPEGWTTSGKLWGVWGEWPTSEYRFEVDAKTWTHLRRLMKAWRVADARASLIRAQEAARAAVGLPWEKLKAHHLRAAKARFRHVKAGEYVPGCETVEDRQTKSRALGLREWIPDRVVWQLLDYLEEEAQGIELLWACTRRPDLTALRLEQRSRRREAEWGFLAEPAHRRMVAAGLKPWFCQILVVTDEEVAA